MSELGPLSGQATAVAPPSRTRRSSDGRGMAGVINALRSALLTGAAIIGAICIAVCAAALLFGVRPQSVISGSMAPAIPTGSMVFAQTVAASTVVPGDVVTVARPDEEGVVTHRVMGTEDAVGSRVSLTLKGDANVTEDPTPYVVEKAGKIVLTVPGLGFLATSLQSPLGLVGAVVFIAAILACFVVQPGSARGRRLNC